MNRSAALYLVKTSGGNFNSARERLEKARAELHRDVVLARKHDISITEIARAAGVQRQTVYNILENDAREND